MGRQPELGCQGLDLHDNKRKAVSEPRRTVFSDKLVRLCKGPCNATGLGSSDQGLKVGQLSLPAFLCSSMTFEMYEVRQVSFISLGFNFIC